MTTIAVIYFSATGHTKQVSEAVAVGAKSVADCSVQLLEIIGSDIKDGRWSNSGILEILNQSDGIIFGTPTYMGGYSAQFKCFIDGCGGIWFKQGWKNKIAAGFTHSMGLSGDKLNTLNSLAINALQHGMIWVGATEMPQGTDPSKVNRLSSYSGAMAQSNMDQPTISDGDRETATLFGKRVAEATLRWGAGA